MFMEELKEFIVVNKMMGALLKDSFHYNIKGVAKSVLVVQYL